MPLWRSWSRAIRLGSTFDVLRLLRAVRYTSAGLRNAVVNHTSFRQELIVGGLLVPVAVWLGEGGAEYALMLSALVLVLVVHLQAKIVGLRWRRL